MLAIEKGELHAGGIPVSRLLGWYGDPLYIYDAEVVERQHEKLRAALPGAVDIIYSMKANPSLGLVGFLGRLVNGMDISSLREIIVAEAAGIVADRMYFVGPSKSAAEIRAAVTRNIRCLVIESEQELDQAARIAEEEHTRVRVAIRVNPAFETAGSKLKMGGVARQFGIDEESVGPVIRKAAELPSVHLLGIHSYVGTRILDCNVVARNTELILEMAARLQDVAGQPFALVDIGGGIGVPYFGNEAEFDIAGLGSLLGPVIETALAALPAARFVLESGRYLAGPCGVYASRARFVKLSRGQKYVMLAGGMNHHFATTSTGALVKNHFPIEVLNKMDRPKDLESTICGPLCTPSDVLGKAVKLPDIEAGDIVGILQAGAYGLTASPVDFLSHAKPAEVLVHKGSHHLLRQPGRPEQVLDDQYLPSVSSPNEPLAAVYAAR